MGGGDDCFLSDIWISLAALGMLTQEWQLPWAQALPRPLTEPKPLTEPRPQLDMEAQVTTPLRPPSKE